MRGGSGGWLWSWKSLWLLSLHFLLLLFSPCCVEQCFMLSHVVVVVVVVLCCLMSFCCLLLLLLLSLVVVVALVVRILCHAGVFARHTGRFSVDPFDSVHVCVDVGGKHTLGSALYVAWVDSYVYEWMACIPVN
mgnify:CR=1 FL=1